MFSSVAWLLAWGCLSDVPHDKITIEHVEVPARVKSLIAECKNGFTYEKHEEFTKYVEQLGKERNYAALDAFCKAGFCYAITVYSQILDDKKAVFLCKSFPLGSPEWEYAVWGLSSHRKEAVIGYVKETCRSKDPWVRARCYSLCLKAGWGDLIESAKRDFNNQTPSLKTFGETVGSGARRYVELLPQVQKLLNRKKQ